MSRRAFIIAGLLGAGAAMLNPGALQAQTVTAETTGTVQRASPAASEYPAAAIGDGATTRGFNLSRWAEDWR